MSKRDTKMEDSDCLDKLETLLVFALCSDHKKSIETKTSLRDSRTGMSLSICDQGELLRLDHMSPESFYTIDVSDRERIFTCDKNQLLSHPADILQEKSEVMMLSDGLMKWTGFRKINKLPRGVCFPWRPHVFYEYHFRAMLESGAGEYSKRIVAFDKKGNVVPAMIQGHGVGSPNIEGISSIVAASIIEDAHRSNAMLASVKDSAEVKFPVPLDDYKEIFSDRDGPFNGSRKKSIIHWVAKHIRKSKSGNYGEVKKHVRGVDKFTMCGMEVSIKANQI